MPQEIERKFLVKDSSYRLNSTGQLYRQGYICRAVEKVVRVRIAGSKAYLTIKGKGVNATTRTEYEYEIPVSHAAEMLDTLCEHPIIEKTRYKVQHGKEVWEVDEFHGQNEGLVVAELEMPSEDYAFEIPAWVGREVTDDPRYLNANLVAHPFSKW